MHLLHSLLSIPSKRLASQVQRFRKQLGYLLLTGQFTLTPDGILLADGRLLRGEYLHRIRERGLDFTVDHNLLVGEGILKMLAIALYTDAKIPAYYLALVSGSTQPTDALSASSFAATMNEIVSTAEGYTGATRPQWVPAAPAAGVISNLANKASFTIATTASVTITGAGLISDNARGGTAGTLISASLFTNAREMFNGETFDLAYQVSLTD